MLGVCGGGVVYVGRGVGMSVAVCCVWEVWIGRGVEWCLCGFVGVMCML